MKKFDDKELPELDRERELAAEQRYRLFGLIDPAMPRDGAFGFDEWPEYDWMY